MCKNGTNRENPVFYIGLSSDYMAFFASAINILQTLVVAIGAGLAVWGVINLLEGYGNDNPGAKSQGIKQLMAGGGVAVLVSTIQISDNMHSALFGVAAYTVILCFSLMKTGNLSRSIFNAH